MGRQVSFFCDDKKTLAERLVVLASHKGGATDGHEYSNVYDSISDFNRPINRENKRVIHPAVGDRGELLSSIKP